MALYNNIYINIFKQSATKYNGVDSSTLTLTRDTIPIIWVDLIYTVGGAGLTPVVYALPAGLTYSCSVSSGYTSTTPVIAESDDSLFNLVADRSDVDPTQGKLCFELDLTGSLVAADLGSSVQKNYHINLMAESGANKAFLGRIPIIIHNVSVEP